MQRVGTQVIADFPQGFTVKESRLSLDEQEAMSNMSECRFVDVSKGRSTATGA
jgi:hypothetical protein